MTDETEKPFVDRRKNWFAKLWEDKNGIPDDARISAGLLVLTFIGATGWSVYSSGKFDPQTWGVGCGAMAAGIGGWFKLRGSE